ncbi:hypothetical protein J6590_028648 [Homalodisca vitripennis]|nr:hypothetical protein J6590_028648 [Homalodisca vitripennis]
MAPAAKASAFGLFPHFCAQQWTSFLFQLGWEASGFSSEYSFDCGEQIFIHKCMLEEVVDQSTPETNCALLYIKSSSSMFKSFVSQNEYTLELSSNVRTDIDQTEMKFFQPLEWRALVTVKCTSSSSSMGRPNAMHLSLKGVLCTREAHHEAYQSMISAVPQSAKTNLSGPPGEIHHPCPNYQRWHTAFLLLKGKASVWQFHPAHHTFYRADLPEGCRLCEDASSGDHVPRHDLFSERRSDVTMEEGDCSTILLILMPGCNLHLLSCSVQTHFETASKDSHLGIPQNASVGRGISSFIPRDPLMTRNPTNSYIVDSGKGRNDLIAIPDKFGFEHTRVQRHQFGSDGPVYENTVGYLQPSPSLLLSYSPEDDVEDHIYDYVDNSLLESRPANIFLSLLEGEGTTISPDPNIYEVPPGAIFNSESCFEELFPLSDISPPNGFQDKLTWERFHLISGNGEDNNEAIYSLPIKFSLNGSAIVKPRKKKLRPGIEELLNQITTMKDTTMEEEQKDNKSEEQELPPQNDLTKDVSLKSESKSPTEPIDSVSESFPVTVSTCPSSNEVIVENINHAIPINLTVLQATVDSLPVEATEVPEPRVTETQDPLNSKEFTSIIEISGDGTWNTAKIPSSHVETSKAIESIIPDESAEQDFLTVNADARAKHVTLAYSGQYYTGNCPVASIKPMKHEQDASVDTKKNIGAQIMEKYEEERKKIIEIKNLPDISLLDVDESLEEIQKERRKIIESQAVRAKRIDSWIKGNFSNLFGI